jgi:hypothetical protein
MSTLQKHSFRDRLAITTIASVALFLLLMLPATGVATQKSGSLPIPNPLQELMFLEGRWEGRGVFPDVGEVQDTYVFRKLLNENFLHVDYEIRDAKNALVWKDYWVLYRDPGSNRLKTVNFGQDGSIASSTAVSTAPDRWRFTGVTKGSAQFSTYYFELRKIDPGTIEFSTSVPRDGKLDLLYKARYKKR